LAFVGHDLGHNSVTQNQWYDNVIGVTLGNFAGGISTGWWKRSHNVHHIVCNSVEHDPDIQHLPALSISSKIFKGFWSTYHMKAFVFDPVARFLVAYQHVLYYPIMGLARVNLYI
jgi:delta8-fatty-acid desaturase